MKKLLLALGVTYVQGLTGYDHIKSTEELWWKHVKGWFLRAGLSILTGALVTGLLWQVNTFSVTYSVIGGIVAVAMVMVASGSPLKDPDHLLARKWGRIRRRLKEAEVVQGLAYQVEAGTVEDPTFEPTFDRCVAEMLRLRGIV